MVKNVVVIGAGPAGLMAAETLARGGAHVVVYEAMASVGRKFLMAGRGGLNLTHAEPFEAFVARYGAEAAHLRPCLEAFPPAALRDWADDLGADTFVGTSGRVFPRAMKASPLLRAWLARLAGLGVRIETRRRWRGWTEDGALRIDDESVRADATILALGGASWSKLGSDGSWADILATRGVALTPFRAANAGFTIGWSDIFRDRFAGAPLKGARFTHDGETVRGEAIIARTGLEGGGIYALSRHMRDAIERDGATRLVIDLRPDLTHAGVAEKLGRVRAGETASNRLRRTLGLTPAAIGLMREAHGAALAVDADALASQVKSAPLTLTGVAAIDRAISTAGGVRLDAVTPSLELKTIPHVFIAGEMLDWEAPTGGYLLQACFATGVAAARGALAS